jgi:hypothetical protein
MRVNNLTALMQHGDDTKPLHCQCNMLVYTTTMQLYLN